MTFRSVKYASRAVELAGRLNELADDGQSECDDDECMLLCAIVRDCAYRIRRQAERQLDAGRRPSVLAVR